MNNLEQRQFEQVKKLLDLCFDVKDYVKGFPQVFDKFQDSMCIVKRIGDEIVSFCAFNEVHFKIDKTPIRAFCIGSVCTHPDYRGKGYGEDVMTQAVAEGKKRGVDVLILFSAVEEFYQRLGFETCGGDVLFKFDMGEVGDLVGQKTKALRNKNGEIDRRIVYEAHPERLAEGLKNELWEFICKHSLQGESELAFEEFSLILKTIDMSIAYSKQDDSIVACGFYGKGHDFKNVFHGIYFKNVSEAFWLMHAFSLTQGLPEFFVFPGAHAAEFQKWFHFTANPTLMIMPLTNPAVIMKAFKKKKLYVRSLQST